MVHGVDSNTFNWLQATSQSKQFATDNISELRTTNKKTVSTVNFFMSYATKSMPVFLPGMAKSWPAYEKWRYSNSGTDYLSAALGDKSVTVYDGSSQEVGDIQNHSGDSF